MAVMNGYSYKKSDQGLGLGGNPRLNERPDSLTDSADAVDNVQFKADSTYGKDELVVEPQKLQKPAPVELSVQDFLKMMEEGD